MNKTNKNSNKIVINGDADSVQNNDTSLHVL